MYKATIGPHDFDIETGIDSTVNGQRKQVNFSQHASGSFVLTVDGKTKEADVVKLDKENKTVIVRIEGKKFTIQLKEPVDLLLEKLGITIGRSKKVNHLKAPMPGLVIKILAAAGGTYKAGEPLLILEAMKMENVFKAAEDVTIKEIQIKEKQTVEKGQILLVFE